MPAAVPMTCAPWPTLALIAVISFFASALGNIIGFCRMPAILTAIALVVCVEAAVLVTSVVGLVTNIARLHTYSCSTRWRPALICAAGAAPGTERSAKPCAGMPTSSVTLVLGVLMHLDRRPALSPPAWCVGSRQVSPAARPHLRPQRRLGNAQRGGQRGRAMIPVLCWRTAWRAPLYSALEPRPG